MAKSIGLLGICLFLFAVLPLIISSSYSKVHRLYVLAGDTEIEMNICWRSTLVERSGRGENWTRKETELQYRPLKPCAFLPLLGGSWSENSLSALAHVGSKGQICIWLPYPVTSEGCQHHRVTPGGVTLSATEANPEANWRGQQLEAVFWPQS